MAKVAVVRTTAKTVIEDYHRVMNLASYQAEIDKKKETILKLNLSWSLYYPACSTEPWQLDGVLNALKKDKFDFSKIHAVENKTVVTDPKKGAKENKWVPVLKKYNLDFEPLTEKEWVNYKLKHKMIALDKVFSPHGKHTASDYQIPGIFKGKNVIHLPTIKTHGHTLLTGAMKNAFGGLITTRRHHCHKMIHEVLVDLLTIQKEIHPGIFAVVDGTVCGDGAGPRTMIPRIQNILVAGADQVGVDAALAHLMGYDPMEIPFIRIAHEKGLGCGDIDKIEIAGLTKKEFMSLNFGFKTNKSPVIFWDQMLRRKIKFIEPLLFHTPLFKICIMGSETYHDKVWYNLVGRRRIEEFMKTEWGELWRMY